MKSVKLIQNSFSIKQFLITIFFLYCQISIGSPFARVNIHTGYNLVQSEILTIETSNVECINIVESSDACQIVEIKTKSGAIIYNVIAAIATVALPDIAKGICNATLGDPHVCNAVYSVTEMLVSIRGIKIYRGATKGLLWIANRAQLLKQLPIKRLI